MPVDTVEGDFMDFGLSMLIPAGLQMLGSLTSTAVGGVQADKNLEFQREVFDYQKALQERIFEREDSAVQRRVNDLVSSGLSPVLAAGSASNAGSVVPVTAPQRNQDFSGIERALGSFMEMANIKLMLSQSKKNEEEANYIRDFQSANTASQTELNKVMKEYQGYLSLNVQEQTKYTKELANKVIAEVYKLQQDANYTNALELKALEETQLVREQQTNARLQGYIFGSQAEMAALTTRQKYVLNEIYNSMGLAPDLPEDLRQAVALGDIIYKYASGQELTYDQQGYIISYGIPHILSMVDSIIGDIGQVVSNMTSLGKSKDLQNFLNALAKKPSNSHTVKNTYITNNPPASK